MEEQRMKWIKLCILIFPFICLTLKAQTPDEKIRLLLENLVEETEGELDYSDIVDTYNHLAEKKININSDDLSILVEFHFLDPFQLEKIKEYRYKYGDITIMEELSMIDELTEDDISILMAIIKFSDEEKSLKTMSPKNMVHFGKHKIIAQTGTQLAPSLAEAYPDYIGSSPSMLLRYEFTFSNKIEAGFVVENDLGEPFFQKGYAPVDYYGFYAALNEYKWFETIVLGNYSLAFGQGLTLGSGLNFNDIGSSLMRRNKKVRPCRTANEGGALNGIASTLNLGNFDVTVFYSLRNRDASISIEDTVSGEVLEVLSLQTTGSHRTATEQSHRHVVKTQLVGANLSFNYKRFHLGYTIHHSKVNAKINPKDYIYNKYKFRGKELLVQGLDFHLVLNKISFYGEGSMSEGGRMAGIVGLTFKPNGIVSFTASYRDYAKDYKNLYGNAYGSSADERGCYFGATLNTGKGWSFGANIDRAKHLFLKSTALAPSQTDKMEAKISKNINNKLTLSLQYKYNDKTKNSSATAYQKSLVHHYTRSVAMNVGYMLSSTVDLKNKIYVSEVSGEEVAAGRNWLFAQDVHYKNAKSTVELYARYALFDAPFGSVYAYENDVLYAFGVSSMTHTGMRCCVLMKLTFFKRLNVSAKCGATVYKEPQTIGKSVSKIKSDAKVQFVLRL